MTQIAPIQAQVVEHGEAIEDIKKKLAQITAELSSTNEEGCSSNCYRASERANSVDTCGNHRREQVRMKVQEKLEQRISVSGYLGTSMKSFRESHFKQILSSSGNAENYHSIKVFAKGVLMVAISFWSSKTERKPNNT